MGKVRRSSRYRLRVAVMYHSFDHTFVLTGLLDRWFGRGESLYAEVSSASPTARRWRRRGDLGDVHEHPPGRSCGKTERIRAASWAELKASSTDDPAVAAIVDRFRAFLRNHRHRGAAYKDIMFHRWGDRRTCCWTWSRRASTALPRALSPRTGTAAAARGQATQLLRRVRFRPIRRLVLRTLFKYNEIYMAIRNDHRFYFDRLWFAAAGCS